jgi:hypothetical protein
MRIFFFFELLHLIYYFTISTDFIVFPTLFPIRDGETLADLSLAKPSQSKHELY